MSLKKDVFNKWANGHSERICMKGSEHQVWIYQSCFAVQDS